MWRSHEYHVLMKWLCKHKHRTFKHVLKLHSSIVMTTIHNTYWEQLQIDLKANPILNIQIQWRALVLGGLKLCSKHPNMNIWCNEKICSARIKNGAQALSLAGKYIPSAADQTLSAFFFITPHTCTGPAVSYCLNKTKLHFSWEWNFQLS